MEWALSVCLSVSVSVCVCARARACGRTKAGASLSVSSLCVKFIHTQSLRDESAREQKTRRGPSHLWKAVATGFAVQSYRRHGFLHHPSTNVSLLLLPPHTALEGCFCLFMCINPPGHFMFQASLLSCSNQSQHVFFVVCHLRLCEFFI